MKQDEIWFITSKESPIPPKSIQQEHYIIDCVEIPVLTDYRITKCTANQASIPSDSQTTNDDSMLEESDLSKQLAMLNENILQLNQSESFQLQS